MTDPAAASDPAVAAARAYRAAHGPRILRDFATLLAIPNVARDLPNMERNAAHIGDALVARGVEAELWHLPEVPPIVYGKLTVPGAKRTLGVYVHYDGQPVDAHQWSQSPWTPTLYTAAIEAGGVQREMPAAGEAIDPEWRLYARAAGDDKAPISAILTALDALQEAQILSLVSSRLRCPVTVAS